MWIGCIHTGKITNSAIQAMTWVKEVEQRWQILDDDNEPGLWWLYRWDEIKASGTESYCRERLEDLVVADLEGSGEVIIKATVAELADEMLREFDINIYGI